MKPTSFLIEGPTKGRFYASMGDYWVVTSESVKGERAALRLKILSQLSRWIAHAAIPLMISVPCAVGEIILPCPWLSALGLGAAVVAGVPLYFLRRQEFAFIDNQSPDVFVLMTNGDIIVHGQKLDVPKSCKRFFEHRHYFPSEDTSSFSELDLAIVDGSVETRYHLATGAAALKHAKHLSAACDFELYRTKIPAG